MLSARILETRLEMGVSEEGEGGCHVRWVVTWVL
jgi:hypothetical protein